MQFYIQIRRADGSTYPTTVEADSLQDARRKAQFVTEGGETVENITEGTGNAGTTTTQAMNNAFASGPTTLDELYKQFEIQRAQPQAGINQEFGATDRDDVTTPIITTGQEATGAGFQPGAYQGPMAPVEGQTRDVSNLNPLGSEGDGGDGGDGVGDVAPFYMPNLDAYDEFETPLAREKYNNFENYIDRFLSDNARISGFARGVDKLAPGQGLGQSILYKSGPIGEYFSYLQPEAEATYLAEDVTRNFGTNTPQTMKTFDDFTSEFLQGDSGNTLFEKQTASFSKLLNKYRSEQEASLGSSDATIGKGVASSFSDKSSNTGNVINFVRGMANNMYGSNYMRYVSPDSASLYDEWSRTQANALRKQDSRFANVDEDKLIENAKTKSFKGKTSFLEYAATAYGVPTDQGTLDNFTKNQFLGVKN